jgi:hypothetical protein
MAQALRVTGAEVAYTELPAVGHDSWIQAFDAAELPRWLLGRRRPGAGATSGGG